MRAAVALVFLAIGVGCGRNDTGVGSETASPSEAVERGEITAMVTNDADPEERFYRPFRYHVVGPVDHRVSVWSECWREGRLNALSPLTRGRWYVPSRGKRLEGYFEFRLVSGKKLASGAAGKVRWEWKENWQSGGVSGGEWISDPFAGLRTCSTWDANARWTPSSGETCVLVILRADKNAPVQPASLDESVARRSQVCLLLKMRFDPAAPAEQHNHSHGGSLDVQSIQKQ